MVRGAMRIKDPGTFFSILVWPGRSRKASVKTNGDALKKLAE